MKRITLLIYFLLNSFLFAQSDNFLVEYKYNFTNDSLNKSDVKTDEFVMRIHPDGYVFLPKSIFRMDTIPGDITQYMKNGVIQISEMYKQEGYIHHWLRLFYNKSKNNYLIQANVSFTRIDFEDNIPSINWKLVNEEKNINGYKAKKALTNLFGRNWEAWYTEEIPISYGPYKFHGLPGLILEIKDSENYFDFQFVSLTKSNSSIPKPKNYQRVKMTRVEFEEYIKKYKQNPFIVLGGRNTLVKDDEEFLKRKKLKLEANNNSIERGLQLNLK